MADSVDRKKYRGKLPDGAPNPIDAHVGSRVRLRRTLLGLSQEALGDALGLTFQQVQKYERGANRIGASRLYDLSRVLDVPVGFFFDDLSDGAKILAPGLINANMAAMAAIPEALSDPKDPMAKRETLELARAYYAIPDPHIRRAVYDLAKSLSSALTS